MMAKHNHRIQFHSPGKRTSSRPLGEALRSFRSFGPKKKEYLNSTVSPGTMERGELNSVRRGKNLASTAVSADSPLGRGTIHILEAENAASGDESGAGLRAAKKYRR